MICLMLMMDAFQFVCDFGPEVGCVAFLFQGIIDMIILGMLFCVIYRLEDCKMTWQKGCVAALGLQWRSGLQLACFLSFRSWGKNMTVYLRLLEDPFRS